MWIDLEPVAVESITILIATDVVYDHLLSYMWPDVGLRLAVLNVNDRKLILIK